MDQIPKPGESGNRSSVATLRMNQYFFNIIKLILVRKKPNLNNFLPFASFPSSGENSKMSKPYTLFINMTNSKSKNGELI